MEKSDDQAPARPVRGHGFPDTRWSLVLRAGSADSGRQQREALESLCLNYWHPVLRIYSHAGKIPGERAGPYARILSSHSQSSPRKTKTCTTAIWSSFGPMRFFDAWTGPRKVQPLGRGGCGPAVEVHTPGRPRAARTRAVETAFPIPPAGGTKSVFTYCRTPVPSASKSSM